MKRSSIGDEGEMEARYPTRRGFAVVGDKDGGKEETVAPTKSKTPSDIEWCRVIQKLTVDQFGGIKGLDKSVRTLYDFAKDKIGINKSSPWTICYTTGKIVVKQSTFGTIEDALEDLKRRCPIDGNFIKFFGKEIGVDNGGGGGIKVVTAATDKVGIKIPHKSLQTKLEEEIKKTEANGDEAKSLLLEKIEIKIDKIKSEESEKTSIIYSKRIIGCLAKIKSDPFRKVSEYLRKGNDYNAKQAALHFFMTIFEMSGEDIKKDTQVTAILNNKEDLKLLIEAALKAEKKLEQGARPRDRRKRGKEAAAPVVESGGGTTMMGRMAERSKRNVKTVAAVSAVAGSIEEDKFGSEYEAEDTDDSKDEDYNPKGNLSSSKSAKRKATLLKIAKGGGESSRKRIAVAREDLVSDEGGGGGANATDDELGEGKGGDGDENYDWPFDGDDDYDFTWTAVNYTGVGDMGAEGEESGDQTLPTSSPSSLNFAQQVKDPKLAAKRH